ncbi:aldehyde dehydrogenase family protein [Rothia nasisuis]|uniref:aldehyde dehydrogenase family protein n=1 Tax=Rothia nasisuis TaxID=2109647 RepID=UPI001F18BBD0|nr:aldehyde dehydrogenase family protein [Rothia nasisuis]
MSVTQLFNPSNGQLIREIPQTSAEQTGDAIEQAAAAQPGWAATDPAHKAAVLREFARLVHEHRQELADLEVLNSGHTISNALWEADNVHNVLNYYAAAPERLFGRQIPVPGGINITYKEPLGVVGVIVPWNFPMPIAGWGFAPALTAGNAVVLKPAEVTPLTALRLAELGLQAGLPEGLFTVLPGRGSVVGETMLTHPLVRKIVFTGSTDVGKHVLATCAQTIKRTTLELGGKNANIVFADADIEKAAHAAPGGVFDNSGQDCCSRSRLLVQKDIYDEFMGHFETAVQRFRVGDPQDTSTDMGPLITASHADSVRRYIEAASVSFTGSCPTGPGNWVAPTVLTPDSIDTADFNEEIFGPVVSVVPFSTEEEAIAIANNTEYGLSGSLWTGSLDRAIRASRAIETGNLSVNSHASVRYWTPFGGFKQSGLGRELGPDAVDAFTETKNVFYSA